MASQGINQAVLVGLDFDTMSDDIRAQLQVQFASSYNDFVVSSMGVLLIDLVSYALDNLAFYMDRRASDAFLQTARTRSSIALLTRQIGYKMSPAVASSVDLQVALKEVQTIAVPVPVGFQFKGPNGLIFEAAESVTFDIGAGPNNTKTIPCYEGETVTESFTSNGQALQSFQLARVPKGKFIVQGSVQVKVDGLGWTEQDFITFDASNQYEIGYNDDPPTISFGDGIAGNIPANGSSIQVQYVASRGKAGQATENTITDVVNKLVVAFTPIDLVVTNPLGASGGDDPESLASAKANGPSVIKTNQSAVTGPDYTALAGAFSSPLFGRVAAAHAFSPRSASGDLVVSNALLAIETLVSAPLTTTSTQLAIVAAQLSAIAAQMVLINSANSSIATNTTSADSTLSTTIDSARDAKNSADEITADVVGIAEKVGEGKAAVDAIASGGTDALTTATKAALKQVFDQINTVGATISSTSSTMKSSIETQITDIGTARQKLVNIGLDVSTAGTNTKSIADATGAVSTATAAITTANAAIAAIVVDTTTQVSEQADIINEHFDKILSDDCKANVVIVPILTRDASGFYVAPSLGLLAAVQAFLDERKEVSQVVQVVSGGDSLILAQISIQVGVLRGFSQNSVAAAVASVVDGILKDRLFGVNLRRSTIDTLLRKVKGVSFVDVTIDGNLVNGVLSTGHLDPFGNLIVSITEVISKGSVLITTEVAESTTEDTIG